MTFPSVPGMGAGPVKEVNIKSRFLARPSQGTPGLSPPSAPVSGLAQCSEGRGKRAELSGSLLEGQAWCSNGNKLPRGTQSLKVRNLGQAGHATVGWRRSPNCKASSVSWRQNDRENVSPIAQVRVSEWSVWLHFRHQADL